MCCPLKVRNKSQMPTRIYNQKRPTIQNVESMDQLELSCIAAGNINSTAPF